MASQRNQPPPGVQMTFCPTCQGVHPDCFTLTAAGVAWMTNYSIATIYTYSSKGLMPEPARRTRGSAPRWTPCAIFQWMKSSSTDTPATGDK